MDIQNYSIYLKEIKGQYFLFSYFEYAGHDFDADMKKMAAGIYFIFADWDNGQMQKAKKVVKM